MIKKLVSMSVAIVIIMTNIQPITSSVAYEKIYNQDKGSSVDNPNQYSIYGYAFIDENHSGVMKTHNQRIADLNIKLWKNKSLLLATKTDEQGYYEFQVQLTNDTYYLTTDSLENYALSQNMTDNQNGNQFLLDYQNHPYTKIQWNNDSLGQYNIGFKEHKYKLNYDLNGGFTHLEMKPLDYHVQDIVTIVSQPQPQRNGYIFAGWNTCVDGSGETYQSNETFIMPSHSVTLYALWHRINEQPVRPSAKYLKEQNHILTLDDSYILLLLLLLLASLASVIVLKSLKKQKK